MAAASSSIKPLIDALAKSTNEKEFAAAADDLALWVIGEGKLPEGIEAPAIRDAVSDAYESLPIVTRYACEKTRNNGGICYSRGANAEAAYSSALRELRTYFTRKGKGSLMSDGVSAANSAAF